MPPKLYKAADVCEMAQLQPYVLRSWETEFPGIGVQKSQESPRLYRQSDVEQVLRIKQLVFGEGLTLAGARKRLDELTGSGPSVTEAEVAEVLDALGAAARTRIANVQQGLQSILRLLGHPPGQMSLVVSSGSASRARPKTKPRGAKPAASKGRVAMARTKARAIAKPVRAAKPASGRKAKRGRA
jgi:DNA-binding transcriptional MerR regulator